MSRGPKAKLRVVAEDGKAMAAAPKPPTHVPKNARDVWQRVTVVLQSQGRLTDANRDVVELYVSAIATVRRCQKEIDKASAFFDDPKGGPPKPHPAFSILAEAEKQARMAASRLGLIEESRDAKNAAQRGVKATGGTADKWDV